MERVDVGSFALVQPLGLGGMGRVWEAVHQPSGERVALKAMTGSPSHAALRAFQSEVEAVAAMNHDAIVLLYDHGILPAPAAHAMALAPGSPWLAMQLCSLGSLQPEARWPTGWAELRQLLLTVLSALAHAHARGVVHRDLKPGNLLLGAARDVRPGIFVADFGLARIGTAEAIPRLAGTPAYLPPEQLTRRGRDVGPWTDLYALGCVAWELTTGHPPFEGPDPQAVARAHRHADLPPLVPRVAVPAGLEPWLASLLEKQPSHRPGSAARAAWMLRGVGGDLLEPRPVVARPGAASGTFSFSMALEPAAASLEGAGPERPENGEAPFPREWPHDPPALSPHLLLGAGEALLVLRPLPFVGRLAEREASWAALGRTVAEGAQRVVVVSGPRGVGRSHLARWLAVAAREQDAAEVLEVSGTTGGLAGALGRALALDGLDEAERRAVVASRTRLPDLLEVVLRGAPAADQAALLVDQAHRRPLLVVVDDADAELVELATHALQLAPVRAAPLMIAIVADEPPGAGLEAPLAALQATPGADRIHLGPLSHESLLAVLRQALGLRPSLADRIAEESGGSPGDAMSVVVHLTRRGLLRLGPEGFELAAEAAGRPLPSASAVRVAQTDRILDETPSAHLPATAIAAMLGTRCPITWWEAACAEAGIAADAAALDPWARLGLLHRVGGEHRLSGEARARITDHARADARYRDWSRACARACERHAADPGALLAAGVHHLEAGEPLAALDVFQRQFDRYRRDDSPFERSARVVDLWADALRVAGVPDHDPRWGVHLRARAVLLNNAGRCREALAVCEEHLERIAAHGWPTRTETLSVAGQIARRAREPDRALAMLEEVLATDPTSGPQVLRDLGVLARMRGDLDSAADYARRSLAAAEAEGDANAQSAAHNDLGAVFDDMGSPLEARACFERALALCESSRVGEPIVVRLNLLGLDLAAGGSPEVNLARALELLSHTEERLLLVPMAGAVALVLEAAARARDWAAFDRAAARVHSLFPVLVSLSSDITVHLRQCGHLARAAGQDQRAAAVESQADRLRDARASEPGR